ncbi:peptidylprolyl isomerase [Oryzifoliimicrobium ureilyticus]|uniref:peptidylprolyl isomerase n=1 Tax=Oryzifoliimicrobium ureilyticus TaxID=3113724 RepID=UPI0030767D38
MFDFLRRAAQTWVAKLLFAVLILAFGIWGVSRDLLGGGSPSTVVTVGDQKISNNEFYLAYRQKIAQMSQQFGTQIAPDQARAFGLDRMALSQVVAGASLDQLAADMNLGLSKDKLGQLIGEDPAFKVNGKFEKELFSSRLRNEGIAEKTYLDVRQREAVRSQIVDAVSGGFTPSKTVIDALKLYSSESRTIDYLLLTNANIEPIKAPPEDVLAKWFEGVKSKYRAPEYRKIGYLRLLPEDIADASTVSDDEVRDSFDKSKANFTTAATRTIEQLSFANKDLADAAEAALKVGTTFDQLVKDQGKTSSDVMLGTFSKDKVPDPAIADPAFAITKEGGTSPVVQGSFGPVILRVTNIKPESTKTLDEVREEVRKQVSVDKAAQQVSAMRDRIDEMRASGQSLEQIASELKLKVAVLDAVDQSGADKNGNEIKDIPLKPQLLAEAFKTEIGAQPSALALGNTGYLWFDVRDITPARDRTISEVHDKALADWTAEQQKTELAKKTKDLLEQAKKGTSLQDIGAPMGIDVTTKTAVTRSTDDPVLGQEAIKAAFSGPVDTVASAVGADPATQILLKVTNVNTQPAADALTNQDAQIKQFAGNAVNDMLEEMVNQLQTQYTVNVNQTAFEQATSR